MANVSTIPSFRSGLLVVSLLFSTCFLASVAGPDENPGAFGRTLDRKLMGLKKEKLSHFRFYWHDVQSGKNPSSIMVVPPVNNSQTNFGQVNMIDNPLTLGPEIGSKMVGRAQGFYALADQGQTGLLMAQNLAFMEGKYNGSTITVLGRNPIFNQVREMPIVGGSGVFRFARGYVQAHTHTLDIKTKDATVEYNVLEMSRVRLLFLHVGALIVFVYQ
ncbi:hypothetical protein CRG98_005992 [Punica granatum]|uniref:Dirigent protein n=1 Tax=Punica granatum TaxID=22663 RepID=A0A2I0KYR5_PUNGR|nr:hypothetical protein CRG98_005992 [Punica granatum]